MDRALRTALAQVSRETVSHRIAEVVRADKREALQRVRCPVMYLRGRHDALVGSTPLRDIQHACPETTVAIINGPHMLLATNAAEATDAIERFIATPP